VTCGHAINILKTQGIDQIPVVSDSNQVLGVITEGHSAECASRGRQRGTWRAGRHVARWA
jgi:hypothetical protein